MSHLKIGKSNPNENATLIPNEIISDSSLSLEAKGLLVVILSAPKNQEVTKKWILSRTSKITERKLNYLIGELHCANCLAFESMSV